MSTECPQLPWQKVASDMFEWRKNSYLLIVDYYSRWIEIAKLSSQTSECVIEHMSSIFARHGIPEELTSDIGSQYTSEALLSLLAFLVSVTSQVVLDFRRLMVKLRGRCRLSNLS